MAGSIIRLKRAIAATWQALNPILKAGEPGWVTDVKNLKVGDDVTAWNDLPYLIPAAYSPKEIEVTINPGIINAWTDWESTEFPFNGAQINDCVVIGFPAA